MSHGSLRLKLNFDRDLRSDALHRLSRHIMYLPPFMPPDIGGLASLIQHDFGINEPQGLALSIDLWRLPLCSSTAVLQNNDNLKVARSTGPDPLLQISGGLPWTRELPAVPQRDAAEQDGTMAIQAAATTSPAQPNTKKRKREQTHAGRAPAQKPNVLPSESDSSEESESESEESEESEDEAPAKRPSRNARRKKHKRQLKRLGLLEGKPGKPGSTPSTQHRQQDMTPQAAVNEEADRTASNKRRRAEEPPARPQQEEAEDKHESGHAKLPKRGEQWQQSADVAEFVQKGHVHFMDSDSDNDVSRAQKAPAVHQQAAQMPSAATVGITSSQKSQQRPGQGPVRERAQPPPQVEHRLRVDYDALPKPQPYPLEGDVIAYRLLHIGADWTPQVSEWREGRILSLDTAQQSVVVEPCGQNRTSQRNTQAQNGDAFEDEDEEEQPPTEYDEDGMLTTSLHSFSDLRVIKDMASSMPGSGARERRRQQVESVPEEADEPGVDRVGDLGCLPPPPLVNGLRPGPGHTASARPAQPASAPVSKPVSRHTEEQKQPAPARSERSQHQAEVSQRAQVAAKSTQPAPAQQAPAEHGASPPVPPAKERPGTLLEAIMSSRHQQAAPATKVLPTEPTPPIHSPLGPPVSGGIGSRSPAGFAQVAAALKARRAELAARQKASAAKQQAPQMADGGFVQIEEPAQTSPQAPPAKSVQAIPALEQASNELAKVPGSQAAGQLGASGADVTIHPAHEVSISAALASHPGPAVRAAQQHDNGTVAQSTGVKTRSAARQEEHSTILSIPKGSPDNQPSHQPGSVIECSQQEATPEGSGQVHAKRPRASTRGSLIGPLLARLRREEEAAANANGTAADV